MGEVVHLRPPASGPEDTCEVSALLAAIIQASEVGMSIDDLVFVMLGVPFQDHSLTDVIADIAEWTKTRRQR